MHFNRLTNKESNTTELKLEKQYLKKYLIDHILLVSINSHTPLYGPKYVLCLINDQERAAQNLTFYVSLEYELHIVYILCSLPLLLRSVTFICTIFNKILVLKVKTYFFNHEPMAKVVIKVHNYVP